MLIQLWDGRSILSTLPDRSICLKTPTQDRVISVGLFIGWIQMLDYLKHLGILGIYVLMFKDVLYTIIRVSIIVSIVLLSFGSAFSVLYVNSENFNNNMNSFVSVMNMLGNSSQINIF